MLPSGFIVPATITISITIAVMFTFGPNMFEMRKTSMMKSLLLTSLLSVSIFADIVGITPTQLQEKIDKNVVIIDIRTPPEWKSLGIVPTSKTIMFFDEQGKYNIKSWLTQFSKLIKDKNQPFVLVCRSGNRTGQVGSFLANELKYKNVFHLEHGIKSWIKENRKVIK